MRESRALFRLCVRPAAVPGNKAAACYFWPQVFVEHPMNEQLVIKNFGPIKDATVDFKRVTVFIGPTGGGNSTLAKLAAIFREPRLYTSGQKGIEMLLRGYKILFLSDISFIDCRLSKMNVQFSNGQWQFGFQKDLQDEAFELARKAKELGVKAQILLEAQKNGQFPQPHHSQNLAVLREDLQAADAFFSFNAALGKPRYVPAEQLMLSVLDANWPTLISNGIGLPPALLFFAQGYLEARELIGNLPIGFLDIFYEHHDGKDFVRLPSSEVIPVNETASGIQSVTPLLVLLEHLSRNTEQAQSFVIEEPELNLYPTAQQGLLNWLVEKCTKGENDLTITTHSPYILSSCNLLLEAYKVAQQRPELADEIDKVVPRACWLNPEEFAAYYVADGTVKPITDTRTHLIGSNELDAISGDISDSFRKLLRLQKQQAA